MNRYKILSPLGDHSYSSVVKAQNTETNEIVAIKMLKKKFYTWQECLSLREIKVHRILHHPNIIKLKEVIRNREELYLVYEYVEENLYKYYQSIRERGKYIPEHEIKLLIFQIAYTLNYMHSMGYFHRDLNLENVFIERDKNVKLGHMSNAKEIQARPPYTEYVSTRWYRAPEQLLHVKQYSYKVDIFALGCILAELYLMGPLFSGTSEVDQLHKIVSVLGYPSHKSWPEFQTMIQKVGISLPDCDPIDINSLLPNASNEAIDLLVKMLAMNPTKRTNSAEILKHNYFSGLNIEKLLSNSKDKMILPNAHSEFDHEEKKSVEDSFNESKYSKFKSPTQKK